jgi:hypothetical protein
MTSPASPTTTPTPEPIPATTPATPRETASTPPPAPAPATAPAAEPADRASAKAESGVAARRSPDVRAGARRAVSLTGAGIRRLRTLLGEIVWFGCLAAASALLLGAVLVVLDANTRNALVEAVLKAADWADLGVFSRTAGVKQFTGDGAAVKNAITNWGLGAVAWLVVGRVARRVLTP